MNLVRHIVLAISAIALTGFLADSLGKDVSRGASAEQRESAFWIKTKLPDDLLSGRLNVTTVAKSRIHRPGKSTRTAQLQR
jgi:hypothetical protein